MKKLLVPLASLLFLAVLFKLSLHDYHPMNSANQKFVRELSINNVKQSNGTTFANQKSEYEIIQAP